MTQLDRKRFAWVRLEYYVALQRFSAELAEGYDWAGPNAEFLGLVDALESAYASGLGRSTFVKVDHQMLQYVASWVNHLIREGNAEADRHAYNRALEGFVRTLVRAIRTNEVQLIGDHAFYRGFELPDWFVGWAFTWQYTPGEDGDA